MPSINPSHAADAPRVARKAGKTAVAVSWAQSLNKEAKPTPKTVRLSQRAPDGLSWSENFTGSPGASTSMPLAQQAGLEHLQTSRGMPHQDAMERKRRGGRRVDAKVRGAGCPVSGLHHHFAHRFIPIAVRIAEIFDRNAKGVFEFLFAGD